MAWTDAIAAFNASLEEFNRKTNYDFDAASAMREVAFELENESRRGYDKMTERYVEFLRGLQNCGQLESQMAELEPALLSVVRAGVTRVPQLELQARTSR
jgi:hypothetical protein